MPVINRIADYHQDMTAWRRHLHANPEIGFEEVETANFVAAKLAEFGVDEIHRGLGKTGVVGVIRAGTSERKIGLRADMDALPITEASGVEHASTKPGNMHACGHDGHTTMLLGAARYLAETRQFDGTVYVIFQPAEEGLGGAKAMMDEGLFEQFPCDQVFGLHNWPTLPMGQFAMCDGPAMAASDEFRIELKGKGCHAAMPQSGRDPITCGAAIVQALQTIVARQIDPIDNAVLSVTCFQGGDAFNVVPETAKLRGTVRTYKNETRDFIETRMQEITEGIAKAMQIECDFFYRRGYPPTVNHTHESKLGLAAAAAIVGAEKTIDNPSPVMGAEDFAYMLEAKPGAYIWMGTGNGPNSPNLHSAYYDFNDEALPIGVSYWAKLVEQVLARAA